MKFVAFYRSFSFSCWEMDGKETNYSFKYDEYYTHNGLNEVGSVF